jgi:hypothetical protein
VGLLATMLVVMWAEQPGQACGDMPQEGPRRLVLSREVDREHLATDLAWAARRAQRLGQSTSDITARHAAVTACGERLVRQIGTLHEVTVGPFTSEPDDAP